MEFKLGTPTEIERCVKEKLENAVSAPSNMALGETLFAKKQLELAPFATVAFTDWGNWEQDPLNNRSWQWRLNWLSFLSYLLAHHRATGDDAVLSFSREAIQSWLDTYLETDTSYPFEFIWHDHATALRAEQLVLFAYYCREQAPEWAEQHAEFLAYLERALVVHGKWLAKDSFYSEHTNHGLEQARVLLLLGTVFEGKQALEWQQIATRRISSELEFSFTREGVHVENSPAYHIFVFKVFLSIIKDYPADVLGGLAEEFSQFSAKALSFITHILRPDGKLPPIGDTEQLATSDSYQEMFGHTLEYQYFLYAQTQGKQGVVPPVLNRAYPKSGYAIFRDHWPAQAHYHKAFHLIAKVGCSSRYHHQQDEGHISLYAGGEDWLIDSGLYNYINNDPVRKYMRGRPGHNVPLISHASYDKEFEHRLGAWQMPDHSESAPNPYLTMKLDVLPPVAHTRRVQWHFPKDKTITVEGYLVTITSPSGNCLRIELEGEIPDSIAVVKGNKDDKVFSCISYKANQVEPSQALRVVFKDRADLNVITRFKFELNETNTAPNTQGPLRVKQDIEPLVSETAARKRLLHTVMLGNHSQMLDLAKLHRAQGIGQLSALLNDQQDCQEMQSQLSRHYLNTWVSCRSLGLASGRDMAPDKSALDGLEGIDVLLITASGLTDKQMTLILLSLLQPLLQRMAEGGQVWVSDDLPESLKSLCETWATRLGLPVTFVTGLSS